jgi:hypothetical protein
MAQVKLLGPRLFVRRSILLLLVRGARSQVRVAESSPPHRLGLEVRVVGRECRPEESRPYGLSTQIVDLKLWFLLHNGYISSGKFVT